MYVYAYIILFSCNVCSVCTADFVHECGLPDARHAARCAPVSDGFMCASEYRFWVQNHHPFVAESSIQILRDARLRVVPIAAKRWLLISKIKVGRPGGGGDNRVRGRVDGTVLRVIVLRPKPMAELLLFRRKRFRSLLDEIFRISIVKTFIVKISLYL